MSDLSGFGFSATLIVNYFLILGLLNESIGPVTLLGFTSGISRGVSFDFDLDLFMDVGFFVFFFFAAGAAITGFEGSFNKVGYNRGKSEFNCSGKSSSSSISDFCSLSCCGLI